jgi:thiol:disulfide interchange protein
MNKSLRQVWGIFAALCVVVAVALVSKALRPKEIIPWRDDFAAATAEARRDNKPVFAYFTASWCGPCQKLKSTTWADKDVDAALRDYVPARIDIDRNPDLADKYGVRAVPTFVVMGADGAAKTSSRCAEPPARPAAVPDHDARRRRGR